MTISTNDQKVDKVKFEANFDKIFGAKKIKGGSFTQGPDGKMVPRGTIQRTRVNAPAVLRELETFKSPIDGTIISSRGQLAKHNKKHGVTNASDYSEGYIEKKAHARVDAGNKFLKDTRRTDIGSAIDQFTT